MKSKINSRRAHAGFIACACLSLFWNAAAAGQGAVSEAAGAALPVHVATRYRDGDAWVDVLASRAARDGLRELTCSRSGHLFHAYAGARALVRFSRGADAAALLAELGLHSVAQLSPRLNLYWVESRAGEDGVQIAARLAEMTQIASAVPDLWLEHRAADFAIPPDDPHYAAQWYLPMLGIEAAWRLSSGDPATRIAVLDNGCDLAHPDLRDAFAGGHDFADGDDDPSYTRHAQGNEHGTACSGVIAATGNNQIGIAGVCPQCRLLCVRLFGGDAALVPVSSDVAAFEYALEQGAAVVSNSWGFAEATPVPDPLRAIIEMLLREGRGGLGAVVVFAAGNENRAIDSDELGAIAGVLNVGAVNNFGEAAQFSNYGPSVALTAPAATFTTDISGSDGSDPGDYTALFGGTSAACPVVAGVAALLLSAKPSAAASEVVDDLIGTAHAALYASPDASGHDPIYGYGVVDPEAALRRVLGLAAADAGEPQAGRAAVGPRSASHSSGGCSVRGAQPAERAPALGLLLAMLPGFARARRRGRR